MKEYDNNVKVDKRRMNYKQLLKDMVVCAAAFIVLGIIFYFVRLNHNNFEKAMIGLTQEELLICAKSEAQSVEQYITDVYDELAILASNTAIRMSIAEKPAKGRVNRSSSYLEDSYKDIKQQAEAIYMFNAQGALLSRVPYVEDLPLIEDYSKDPDVSHVLKHQQPYIGWFNSGSASAQAITISYPVFSNNKFMGLVQAVVSMPKIRELAGHKGLSGNARVMILDNKLGLVVSPEDLYIDKTIRDILSHQMTSAKIEDIIARMLNAEEGADIYDSMGVSKIGEEKKLIAFSPIHIGKENWSLAVIMDYQHIAKPINRNARDNIIFSAFVIFVLAVLGWFFYAEQKKKAQLDISHTAANIVNKQLRIEIEERKRGVNNG